MEECCREINEVFEFNGTKLKCVPKDGCEGCYFGHSTLTCKRSPHFDEIGFCSSYARIDGKDVNFIEVSN